jgi:DNA-binding NtrC family response regulator
LQKLVQEGKFREDLYYRVNVVRIELPPLRERRDDIPLLAAYFAQKYARPGEAAKQIPPQAMEVLLNYSWPGNIRELENAIERACVTSQNGSILPQLLPYELVHNEAPKPSHSIDLNQPLPELLPQAQADIEQEYIRKALEQCRGNVSQCAQMCGISRRSLSGKLWAYQINKSGFKDTSGSASDNGTDE